MTLASHGGHLGPLLRDGGFASTALEGSTVRVDQLLAAGQEALPFALGGTEPIPPVAREAFDLVIDLYLINHLEHPRRAIEQVAELLVPHGTLVIEYDDVTANVRGGFWDSIGRSHPVYPTLTWLDRELKRVGLTLFDAVERPLYGGAMRVYARAGERRGRSVAALLEREAATGMGLPAGLAPMAKAVALARRDVVGHLRDAREEGRRIAGYGAPARAITFLNALGIGPALLPYVVDRSADKHGRVIPGVGVPIHPPARLVEDQPDEVLVLAWTVAAEVCATLRPVLPRTRFLVAMPVLADVTDPVGHGSALSPPRIVR